MSFAILTRSAGGLIPCWLAAGVLCLAGCEKVMAAVPPDAQEQGAPSCEQWNTEEFFEIATVGDVTACLAAGADAYTRDERDLTPLHWAAFGNQDPAVLEVLLAAGADPETRASDVVISVTPLHVAAQGNENPAVLTVLVAAGADPMARADDGRTPLHLAAGNNENPAVLVALLAAGAKPAAQDEKGGTPLHHAARWSQIPAVIETLLATGVDIEARDGRGETPLQVAVSENASVDVVEALLTGGADPMVENQYGHTPLQIAVSSENLAVIEALLAGGADPMARVGLGSTLLHNAVGFERNPAVIEALIAAGVDLLIARDEYGNTLLHAAAAKNNNPAVVEALIDAGADVMMAREEDGDTPLHAAAARNNNPAIAEALIAAGADVMALNVYGRTPLHGAAEHNGNYAMIEALLAAGADLEARDEDGNTPLHRAAASLNIGFAIDTLLDSGADGTARNAAGQTPWDLAQEHAQGNMALRGYDGYWRLYDMAMALRPVELTGHTVTISKMAVVEGPPLYFEFTISGPFFDADAADRLTIRGIPHEFNTEHLNYLSPETEWYNLDGAFRYGSQQLEFYRGEELVSTTYGGGQTTSLSGVCIDPDSQRLRIIFDLWSGGATIGASTNVFYSRPGDGISDYRISWADWLPDNTFDCAEGQKLRWTRDEGFHPCRCAGRLKGEDYVSALNAISSASSLENPIAEADFTALLTRIDVARPYIDQDQNADLSIQRYESSKFEVVVITYKEDVNLYVDEQIIFVRRVRGGEWVRVHNALVTSKGLHAATIHGFVDEEVLDLSMNPDGWSLWPRQERGEKEPR